VREGASRAAKILFSLAGRVMDKKEFSGIRQRLGKSQKEMAQLLAVSLKAIQSFEQGWRKIPTHAQRQSLFLLAMKESKYGRKPCWDLQECPSETRKRCPAWEYHSGHLCWFISGTLCQGEVQGNWASKMRICRKCKVFKSMMNF
jgi:DNA-binding transcriptional regulator YiaG